MYLNKCKVPSREDNDNNLTVSHIFIVIYSSIRHMMVRNWQPRALT